MWQSERERSLGENGYMSPFAIPQYKIKSLKKKKPVNQLIFFLFHKLIIQKNRVQPIRRLEISVQIKMEMGFCRWMEIRLDLGSETT